MARIVNKARPDLEGSLLADGQDPQQELEAVLQGYRNRGLTVVEESPGEFTVNGEDGQFIGIFYIED